MVKNSTSKKEEKATVAQINKVASNLKKRNEEFSRFLARSGKDFNSIYQKIRKMIDEYKLEAVKESLNQAK